MTTDNPKLSIIIPVYNAANTLDNCLQSIIEQDYKSFDVWLIDAVSTDDTLPIIRKYKVKHTFINFISEPDKGIYDAMNKGINLCTGEWLYFLGGDDTLYNENVLSLVAENFETDKAKVIYGNVIMRGKNHWNLDNVIFNGEYDLEKLVNTNICHQAIFYNRTVFELYGNYNLRYIVGADQDFNLRCFANVAFRYVDIIIANFFVGGHSTNTQDDKFHDDRGALLFKYFKKRIYHPSFLNSRLYIQRAALSSSSPLNFGERLFCFAAYTKLKIQSLFLKSQPNKIQ